MDTNTLTEIGIRHGTDKAAVHGYTELYEELLNHMRDRPIRLLEIGIGGHEDPLGGGESLRMWKEFFPKASIVGLDLHDKSIHAEDRIAIERGDQSSPSVLTRINDMHGPFDVIIDDGSHFVRHVKASFEFLFPLLVPGGTYIVEDIQTSYWPQYGGRLRRRHGRTSMAYFKDRADSVNFQEFRIPRYRPTEFDRTIKEVRFRHNVVALLKKTQAETEATQFAAMGRARWLSFYLPAEVFVRTETLRNHLGRS